MKHIARIHSNISSGFKAYEDVDVPTDAKIENFGFQKGEILTVGVLDDKELERVPLKAYYDNREFVPSYIGSAYDKLIYHFIICDFQSDEANKFGYRHFATTLRALIDRRNASSDPLIFLF